MSCVILYDNYSDQAILSGGDWSADLPLANLQTDDIGRVARSASAVAADTVIDVDLGAQRAVGGVVVGPINLTPGASYRIRGYSDSGYLSVSYDSGSQTVVGSVVDWSDDQEWLEWEDVGFWLGITDSDAADLPLYIVHVVPDASIGAATTQWWRVSITDENNADGHLSIGRLFISRALRPSLNYAESGNEASFEWLTDISESYAGRRTYNERGVRRRQRMAWPYLPESEVFSEWFRFTIKTRTSRQCFIVPEETDDDDMKRKRAFLATLTATPAIAQVLYQQASVAVDAEEVI